VPDIALAVINAKWIHPSLALRLLKANLGEWENRALILEFALRQPLEEKTAPILAAAPRILGLSVSIWNHRATLELLEALSKKWGGGNTAEGNQDPERGQGNGGAGRPVIILGGPEASYLPPESAVFRYADWVIRGEGELVFRELCALLLGKAGNTYPGTENRIGGLSTGIIRGLPPVREVHGKIIHAHPVNLSSIDPGYRLYTDEDLRRKLIYVEASRGCPFGCEFCQSSLDRQVREFPLDVFLGEMDKLINRGGRAFKFLDRTFNLNIRRARRILEFFLYWLEGTMPDPPVPTASAGGDPRPSPGCYVHFEMVPSEFPGELREILTRFPRGTLRLEIGIQSFNPKTTAIIGRPSDPEKELEVLEFLREKTRALVHADLIAGLPGEDLASFARGFDRLWMVRPGEIQLGILKKLPGTPIARHSEAYGMRYAPDPPYEALETSALSRNDLDRIKNFARFWERIVNRGAFGDLVPVLLPEGRGVFTPFMALSDWLLGRFGRNWGINRKDLRAALEEWAAAAKLDSANTRP
jgi:hypothetical protein